MSDYSLEDYDPSRSPGHVFALRLYGAMFGWDVPLRLIPSFSPCSFSTFREWAAIFFGVQAVCGGDASNMPAWAACAHRYGSASKYNRRVFTSLV